MCFYRISKHKRSDTPITVYKVMRKISSGCINSIYYSALTPYLVGQKIVAAHSADTELMDMAFALDREIVHAYHTLNRARLQIKPICIFSDTLYPDMLAIVECEIPPGVEYWLGYNGEIGAREMKIVSINN